MKQYKIEDVQVGVSRGGFACGPVSGNVICEVTLRSDDGSTVYHSLAEVDGTLNFYESETSLYAGQIEDDFSDAFRSVLDESYSGGFGDYEEFYDELSGCAPLSNSRLIWKYLVYLARVTWSEADAFKAATIGKYIGEFEIPVCDAEEEYGETR